MRTTIISAILIAVISINSAEAFNAYDNYGPTICNGSPVSTGNDMFIYNEATGMFLVNCDIPQPHPRKTIYLDKAYAWIENQSAYSNPSNVPAVRMCATMINNGTYWYICSNWKSTPNSIGYHLLEMTHDELNSIRNMADFGPHLRPKLFFEIKAGEYRSRINGVMAFWDLPPASGNIVDHYSGSVCKPNAGMQKPGSTAIYTGSFSECEIMRLPPRLHSKILTTSVWLRQAVGTPIFKIYAEVCAKNLEHGYHVTCSGIVPFYANWTDEGDLVYLTSELQNIRGLNPNWNWHLFIHVWEVDATPIYGHVRGYAVEWQP